MRSVLTVLVVLFCVPGYAQQELSRPAINELVTKTSGFLGLDSDQQLKTAIDKYLATYRRVGDSVAMTNFRNDIKNRRDLLLFMQRAVSNRESLSQMLSAVKASEKTSQEVLEYFFPSNVVVKLATPDTPRAPVDTAAVKPPEPITLQPPSKKFFEGRKTFCDTAGTSYYAVIIIKGNVLLNKYPGKPKDKMSAASSKSKAILSGEDIISSETHAINFRYENNVLYEKDDFGGWSKYVECNE